MSAALWPVVFVVAAMATGACHAQYCSQGKQWLPHSGKCHFLSTNETSNWFQAQLTCRDLDASLVTVTNDEHNDFLNGMSLCKGYFWIGLVNTDPSNKNQFSGYSWWDGSPSGYNKFSYSSSGGDCVYMSSGGRWYNRGCENRTPFVCTTPWRKATTTQPAQYSCPSGWQLHDGSCYFVSSEATNYFNAQMSCQAKGAAVASVQNREEQVFLTILLGCSSPAWIGMERSRPCFTDPSKSDCWVWMDRTPLDYTEWGSQSDSRERECVYTQGNWRTITCYNEYKYVCKKAANRTK